VVRFNLAIGICPKGERGILALVQETRAVWLAHDHLPKSLSRRIRVPARPNLGGTKKTLAFPTADARDASADTDGALPFEAKLAATKTDETSVR
jgi:hypothetical protein